MKTLKIALLFLSCLFLFSCSRAVNKIPFEDYISVLSLEMTDSQDDTTLKITNQEEIAKIIFALKKSVQPTNRQSINDSPSNVDRYISLDFNIYKDDKTPSKAYIYSINKIKYIEFPYTGIWQIRDEAYNTIYDYFKK